MKRTRICDLLGIEYPIIEGGMTMAGNGELAAAVSNAGALGMIGSNPGWVPPDEQADNLRKHIRIAKNLTNKPFGVNFTMFIGMDERTRQLMEVAIEEGVRIAATSGGSPRTFTQYLKDAGMMVMHVLGSVRHARTAEAAGVDIIVAEGYEAGGVNSPDELPTFVLVPQVVDAVSVPVVAAGGIADARGLVAALALGAEGVQMGTRFAATLECHVHQNFKDVIVNAIDTSTIITRRKLGTAQRSLKNEYSAKLLEMDQSAATPQDIMAFLGFGRAREGQILGEVVDGDAHCGAIAGMIKEIISAAEVVRSLVDGYEAVLGRLQ